MGNLWIRLESKKTEHSHFLKIYIGFSEGLLYNGNKEKERGIHIMKKKLVLACLLAGALSMNSTAYASASGQSLGEVTKEAVGNPETVEA